MHWFILEKNSSVDTSEVSSYFSNILSDTRQRLQVAYSLLISSFLKLFC